MAAQNFGSDGACGVLGCLGGLSCLADHSQDKFGNMMHFGWGNGERLHVRLDPGPKGFCLYSSVSFLPGDPVTTYDGHILHKTATPRSDCVDFYSKCTHYHAMHEYVVSGFKDVIQGRGLGSLINHSFTPNVKIVIRDGCWPYYGGEMLEPTHLLVVCCSHIEPGEEILMRYSKRTCDRLCIPYNKS